MNFEEQADAAAELFRQAALTKRQPEQPHTGLCLYCNRPLDTKRAFCDEHCREDHEWLTKRR